MASDAHLHFANRNATRPGKNGAHLHFANSPDTGRHLEQACARLQDAAVELETVLLRMQSPDEQADLHEAIGSIMETMQLITATHARLDLPAAAD